MLHKRRQSGFAGTQSGVGSLALRQVAQARREEATFAAPGFGDREFHRKLGAVRSHGSLLCATPKQQRDATRKIGRKPICVRLAQMRRDDELRDLSADRFSARIAEGLLGRRVEFHNQSGFVRDDHAVER
ncbi:hypothetical protein NKJ19_32070 [Mesorhizobium sp. M0203]